MRQIINYNPNGSIWYKYYLNDRRQCHGLYIYYWDKTNWVNGKKYGFETFTCSKNNIYEQKYYL